MKKETQIDRSYQGKNEVIMTDMPKSGFNLTYNNYFGGLVLGRLIPTAFQWLMPNDKFSGSNEHQLTFEQLSTPVLSDVNVSMHNFYCTLRAVDKDLPALLTPTKLNNMSAAGSTPTFSVATVMKNILSTYFVGPNANMVVSGSGTNILVKPSSKTTYATEFMTQTSTSIRTPKIITHLNYSYAGDTIYDLQDKLANIINSWNSATTRETCLTYNRLFIRCICDFFCGQGSLLDYFGYPIISHEIADSFADSIYLTLASSTGNKKYSFPSDISFNIGAPNVNEYPLRIMYTIWLEYYRNFDVEPLTSNIPDYHTWGSTPLDLQTLVQLLVMRPRCWSADAFISAGVDDISRHVFAPILYESSSNSYFVEPTASGNSYDFNLSDKWSSVDVAYTDVIGNEKTVNVPIPSSILSSFANSSEHPDTFSIELNSLKKAKMLENYLKRMYYGGDEYRDRCLSIYGSRIEDYRINRPELLSSSFDSVAVKQEVANTGASAGTGGEMAEQGTRLATATANTFGQDGFTSFSPEFGMYIGIMSVMPRAQYDPLSMQLCMHKTFDFPAPQFANSMEETIQNIELSRNIRESYILPFGFAPYAHAWRYRVDSVHGQYLDEKHDYCFARVWQGDSTETSPILNSQFLHCRPKLNMFVNQILLDGQLYGVGKHNFLVERVLPTPVETI